MSNAAALVSARRDAAGRSRPSTNLRQIECRRSGARYLPTRVMISAALIRALSDWYGIEPWPGVPRTRWRDRHHVDVSHEVKRGCLRVAPLDPQDEARPAGHRLVPLHFDARHPQIALEEIDAPDLVARFGGSLVHARVADEPL